jgi:hypothetical protein
MKSWTDPHRMRATLGGWAAASQRRLPGQR